MINIARRAFFAAFIAMVAAPQASQAQTGDPVAMVRQIFETYSKGNQPRVPYTPAVQARLKASAQEADEVLSAQDIDVKGFTVREVSRGPDRAVVEANFVSFDRKMRSQFDFRVVDGKWLIANYRILAGVEFPPHDLRKTLKMAPLN